jgi:hypothetical protein
MSKMDEKKRQIYIERRKRALNKGIPEDKVDQHLAKEDFERLPLETRVQHMIDTAFRRLAQEIVSLEYNDQMLSAAMDVNFRAIAKMLEKLGISREQQLELLKEAKEDIEKDLAARKAKQDEEAAAKQTANMKAETEQAGEPTAPPDEATVFGG